MATTERVRQTYQRPTASSTAWFGAPLEGPRPEPHPVKITLDLFTPDQLRSRTDLLKRYFGVPGLQIVQLAQKEVSFSDLRIQTLKDQADQHFFNEIKKTFGLPLLTDGREFYRTSLTAANAAMTSFNNVVFQDEQSSIHGLNEATAPGDSPSRALFRLSSPNVAPRLRTEIERRLLLGTIAGAIEARARNSGFNDTVANIQDVFADSLYEGPMGSVKRIETFAVHDNNTNSVIELLTDASHTSYPYSANTHVKRHVRNMREVADVGYVDSDLDMKDIGSSIIKALRRAQIDKKKGGEGIIDIDVAVHDAIRAKMVVQGTVDINDPKIDRLIERVITVIQDASNQDLLGKVEYIKPDHDKHNQEKKPPFKRLQIKFRDVPVPIEIIFSDQKTDIDGAFQVGTMQPDGHYDGYAHSIYEIQRLGEILDILYSPIVFTSDDYINGQNLHKQVLRREPEIADRLRAAHRITPV